jgi:hypothetical protein
MDRTTWMQTTTQTEARLQPWNLPPVTARGWYTSPPGLVALTQDFDPISLKQMDSVALLNRTDTKFVMSTTQLLTALAALRQDYTMLAVYGQRLNHYRTLYFDAPDFELYNLHVNGRANSYKVRSREYTDSRQSFLEVKHKTNKGRTIKDRISTPQPVIQMTLEAENWLHGVFPFDSRMLEPKMWNTFTRMTLVSKQHCERVTLDVDLTFYSKDKVLQMGRIAIAEVKMDACSLASPFLAQMRLQKIRPQGFSKYCVGVAMLYEQVKKNAIKPKLLWLEKMNRGAVS